MPPDPVPGDPATAAAGLFTTAPMAAAFSAAAHVRRMLAFEAALARAEAEAGVIPPAAAAAIAAACDAGLDDPAVVMAEAAVAGTPAVPLVRALRQRVGSEAAGWVHWGATSQDAVDTALVLQMRQGLDLLVADLLAVAAECRRLTEAHRRTPMVGRTLLQPAAPITFGLKAARWLDTATRLVPRLREVRERALVLQFGGAVGTLAALGEAGPRVAELLGAELALPVPPLPWHAERDRPAEVAAALGIVAGAMAKIATDLVLLRQGEVAEVGEEPVPGKGGSSAMPQKQNPVDAILARAAAGLAIATVPAILHGMAQEHERAAGGWQAEWEAIPRLFGATAASVERVRAALTGLVVDPARLAANLAATGGTVMAEALTVALAARLGRSEAERLTKEAIKRAAADGAELRHAALADERIRLALGEGGDAVFDPVRYLGAADLFIDRALAAHRGVLASLATA